MSIDLDLTRKHSLLVGIPGVHFVQDGKYFGALGQQLVEGPDGNYIPVDEAPEPESENEKFVEFDIDSIADLETFDAFGDALQEADVKHAKVALKAFALDIVGMDKVNTNKGLAKLIAEVRAEYKSVLEADLV